MSEKGRRNLLDAAVLIVNWNTGALLMECLQSVAQNSDGLAVQTIVVDNASSDDSVPMVRSRYPDVTLLALSENLGFVGGNNRAYRQIDAEARYVLLLNPDAALRPQALPTLIAWMDGHPDAGACGPLTLNTDGTLQPSWTRFPTVWGEMHGRDNRRLGRKTPILEADALRRLPEAERVDWVSGACLLLRNAAIRKDLGGVLFDPEFQMYSEETDLCYRLNRAGHPTFLVPQAEVVHHYGQSSRQAPVRTIRLLYQSKLLFFRKHYGARRTALLKAGLGAIWGLKWVLYTLLGLLPSRRRTALAAQLDRQRAVLGLLWEDRRLPVGEEAPQPKEAPSAPQ